MQYQYSIIQYNTIQYNANTRQHNTIQYNTIQYNAIQYNTIQYNTNKDTIQYNTIQYNTIQYNTIQYNTTQYNTIQYNTIQYNTIQYNFSSGFSNFCNNVEGGSACATTSDRWVIVRHTQMSSWHLVRLRFDGDNAQRGWPQYFESRKVWRPGSWTGTILELARESSCGPTLKQDALGMPRTQNRLLLTIAPEFDLGFCGSPVP